MFKEQHLVAQYLSIILQKTLPTKELENCLLGVQILEAPVAKQFWQATAATTGIFIVIAGKVRLLDSSENLIATLTSGESFGEITLFKTAEFQPYTARASTGLKLCYIKGEILEALIDKYPQIRDRLYQKAEIWDLMLSYRQNSSHLSAPIPEILKVLSLCERHSIKVGSVPVKLCQEYQLWLVYRGELLPSDGQSLSIAQIYTSRWQTDWQAIAPTIIYCLKSSDWDTALQQSPQLGKLIGKESISLSTDRGEVRQAPRPKPQGKIIPFPGTQTSRQQSQPERKRQVPVFPSPTVQMGHWWRRLTRRYPYYAQQSASDCGAACLVMIGNYWGKHFSLNRLRDLTNVSRSGATLRAIATAAESLGFATRPVKASFDKLQDQPLPAIIHWEGKHFIVAYEITNKRVVVGDPAIGQRTLTPKEFQAGWTGYALLLEPTTLLKQTKNDSVGLGKFFELVKPHHKVLLEIFLASILVQLFGLLTPVFTQMLLDRVLVQRSLTTLNAVGLGMIVFGSFRVIMSGVRQYLLDHTANRVSVALLVGFIQHTFGLPLSYFESRYVGDIIARVQENQKIQRFLTGETLSILLDLLTLVIYLGMMFWYSWRMGLFVLFTVPPFFILALASTSILRRISREVFQAGTEETSYLIESLTGIRTVRSLSIEQSVRWHWEELLHKVIKKTFNSQIIGNRLAVITGLIETFVNTSLLWYGASLVINGELSIGQLIAFNMLMGNVITPFKRLSQLWNQFQEIIISTERINDVLQAEPEEDLQNKTRKSLGNLRGHIRFQNVSFRYHPESEINILENINFEIQPEQMVAVVGRSGSGKTTLSKLILGLYPPSEGKVLIDGQDVTGISLRSLRSQIGVVDQDSFLFGGTIRENIAIAHPDAADEEIVQAAQMAGADEFIQQMPLGYETQIGESGGMLSGGQRQRLAIARALLGNPRLLLLDEATSHLDAESERIIQKNFKTILKERTSVIIAHRLSTVRNADLILVLDRGLLVESGTHDELIAKKGHYYYLNQQQLAQAV